MQILDVGGGDGSWSKAHYPDADITVLDKKSGWDVMKLGLPVGDWDLIVANHFIEHIDDPDYFLDECRKQMSEKSILEIGIPNLCAWFNRILFLLGYLPHSYELSYRYNLGKIKSWMDEPLGGHIRVFSIPAMIQLLKLHGFTVLSIKGEESFYKCHPWILALDKVLSINPNLASSVRILCKK